MRDDDSTDDCVDVESRKSNQELMGPLFQNALDEKMLPVLPGVYMKILCAGGLWKPHFCKSAKSCEKATIIIAGEYLRQGNCFRARQKIFNSMLLRILASIVARIGTLIINDPDHKLFEEYYNHLDKFSTAEEIAHYLSDHHPRKYNWLLSIKSKGLVKEEWIEEEMAKESDDKWIHVTIVTEEDDNIDRKYELEVNSGETLASAVGMYSFDLNIPIKNCCHIWHEGRTLLKRVCGKKSLHELGVKDGDVLQVRRAATENHFSNATAGDRPKETRESSTRSNQSNKSKGIKKSSNKSSTYLAMIEPTEDDLRCEHSKEMNKVFDEAREKFVDIRKKLDAMMIEKQTPKKRGAKKSTKGRGTGTNLSFVSHATDDSLGGKGGKISFGVLVGNEDSLYVSCKRTSKRSSKRTSKRTPLQSIGNAPNSPTSILKLDLHGLSKREALEKLNKSLPLWTKMAMERSAPPYAIPVDIICGAGSQALSDLCQNWIREQSQVASRPKGYFR